MLRKIVLGVGVAGVTLAMLPLFAAFEAHVVNVTARIENALSVTTTSIDFGTVFPQEHLNKPLAVRLSGSFRQESRVDDVRYFIRQKPKCGLTETNGTILVGPTATGHVSTTTDAAGNVIATIDCGPDPRTTDTALATAHPNATWAVLPSLCEYISKEGNTNLDPDETNDGTTPSFHHPWQIVNNAIKWLDTPGYLSKLANDFDDIWNIDLSVPCFGGSCAQDWANFVHGINPDANPNDYDQDIQNEHKIFGCDLWIEVNGVSRTGE